MKPTIFDVAQKVGVSSSTISKVLNNKGNPSSSLKERVFSAINELNYKPLRKKKNPASTGTIGFIYLSKNQSINNKDQNIFLADYVDALTFHSAKKGFKFEMIPLLFDDLQSLSSIIEKKNFLGLIILATELEDKDILLFEQFAIPYVFLDADYPYINANFVSPNNEQAMYSVVEHLFSQGHTRIGLVQSSSLNSQFRLREKAFYDVLNLFGLPHHLTCYWQIDPDYEKGFSEMMKALVKTENLPTAFVCVNDSLAASTMHALQQLFPSTSDCFAIIGFGNLPSSAQLTPALTTVNFPKHEIAMMALTLLLRQAEHRGHYYKTIRTAGLLIKRQSVHRNC